ncbi:MAG: TetR/AcrR family transcriptional regulator [Myxococcales bacterium]|nr:TetR/AcrR family transcriptional regulator [Myxococcales bacterium]MCB9718602.1 TetR/AcrR family transcriptional regulator [Myxococcales bacterium]
MPRPRYAKLPPERREEILDAAAAEFGEHGFSRASYNRIIERAGLSKGAMYYYFADKEDLYATVMRDTLDGLLVTLQPMPEVADPAQFWAEVERLTASAWAHALAAPRMAALMPALLNPRTAIEGRDALAELYEGFSTWMQQVLERGRAAGAVRRDLPDDLLLGVTMAVGEAIDRWVAKQWLEHGAPAGMVQDSGSPTALVSMLVDLLRRVVAPA